MNRKEKKVKKSPKLKVSHILILLFLIAIGGFAFFRFNTKRKLNIRFEAIRAAGYPVTCEELNEWYSIPYDVENSAYIILDAFGYYQEPNNIELLPAIGQADIPSRNQQIPDEMLKLISQCISNNQECLELLHKTAELEHGRYPGDLSLGINTPLPSLSEIRKCALLLQLEAIDSTERDDSEAVIDSIKSIFGVSRSLSMEPMIISQLVRLAINSLTVSSLEYAMNRTVFSDEQLIELNREFSNAKDDSNISRAFIGERCMIIDIMENPSAINPESIGIDFPPRFIIEAYEALGLADKGMEIYLDLNKELMKALELPMHLRLNELDAIETKINSIPRIYFIIRNFMPSFGRVVEIDIRNNAQLTTAQTALAVQRYRLHNNKLPDSLDNLVPDYLESVPLDPFDGEKIRYKKINPGFVIYSVGENLSDDGGQEMPKTSVQRRNSQWDTTFIVEK